jgi:hypothetical protein
MADATYERLEEILEIIRSILERNGRGQASAAELAILAARRKNRSLIDCLNGLAFWGGSGSICDVIIYSDKQLAEDNQLLLLAEIDLVDEMERLGIARSIAIQKREMLRSSVDYGNRTKNQ